MLEQSGQEPSVEHRKQPKYLEWITVVYITFQLVSDVTAGKLISLFGFPVSITVLYFPITYIFADVLTEVYGYARARNVLWKVMLASIIAGLVYQLAVFLPPAPGFDPVANDAYTRVLGIIPRVLVGGWLAVFLGEITNNFVLAKMKIFTDGRYLWTRTIGSTIAGQFVNTAVFYVVALYGIIPLALLYQSIIVGWVVKCSVEILATPLTYIVVWYLKKEENEDYYDRTTDFNPFILK